MQLISPEKTVILVLGMHRSGTSAITRILNILGAKLPNDLMPPVLDNNEQGFWESKKLMNIHNNILKSAGMSWQDIQKFPDSWWHSPAAQDSKSILMEFIAKELTEGSLFVIKDPRICRFAPLWIEALQELNIIPTAVIPFRNPLEVSASLKLRDNMPLAYSQVLWLRHVIEAERATRNIPRSFFRYGDLLSDWRNIVGSISDELYITWPNKTDSVTKRVNQFLDKGQRHQVARKLKADFHTDLNKWVRRAYRGHLLYTQDNNDTAMEILNNVAEKLSEADAVFSPLLISHELVPHKRKVIKKTPHSKKKQQQKKNLLDTDIKIFQIYFGQSQYKVLDSNFIPYDNSKPTYINEYEFGVFRDNFENKKYLRAKYTGFISWKFYEKTNIKGNEFLRFIKTNPNYDVYFVNPYPRLTRWRNVWLQGDHCHPGILNFTQKMMNKLGYNINLKVLKNDADTLLYCNYWVGNEKFWNSYMNFVMPVYNYIKNEMSPDESEFLHQNAITHQDANYFPFIFERMFSTLLVSNPDNIRFLSLK